MKTVERDVFGFGMSSLVSAYDIAKGKRLKGLIYS